MWFMYKQRKNKLLLLLYIIKVTVGLLGFACHWSQNFSISRKHIVDPCTASVKELNVLLTFWWNVVMMCKTPNTFAVTRDILFPSRYSSTRFHGMYNAGWHFFFLGTSVRHCKNIGHQGLVGQMGMMMMMVTLSLLICWNTLMRMLLGGNAYGKLHCLQLNEKASTAIANGSWCQAINW